MAQGEVQALQGPPGRQVERPVLPLPLRGVLYPLAARFPRGGRWSRGRCRRRRDRCNSEDRGNCKRIDWLDDLHSDDDGDQRIYRWMFNRTRLKGGLSGEGAPPTLNLTAGQPRKMAAVQMH